MTASAEPLADPGTLDRLLRLRHNRLVRQNLILFAGGLVAGIGGFVYHAIAGRILGPRTYGEVASLVAVYTVGTAVNLILILILARYAAYLAAAARMGGIRYIAARTARLLAIPAVAFLGLAALVAGPVAGFLNLSSGAPVVWIALAIVLFWFLAVPRGILQGIQRFTWLAANLASELVLRTLILVVLLEIGLGVSGAALAIVAGIVYATALGAWSIRDLLRMPPEVARMRAMAGFAPTAAAGTIGIILLYSVDVVLAKHYLPAHQAGIYAGLNKIGFIIFALTLSVSQVLFPRVVEAVAKGSHPGRLLLLSAGLIGVFGGGALAVFGLFPATVVRILFGPAFIDATPYVFAVGCIGLALSLNNLLVQFFMAVHDRVFVPILATACALEAFLIVVRHGTVRDVVVNVLVSLAALLVALALRWVLILPNLHPEMVSEGEANPAA